MPEVNTRSLTSFQGLVFGILLVSCADGMALSIGDNQGLVAIGRPPDGSPLLKSLEQLLSLPTANLHERSAGAALRLAVTAQPDDVARELEKALLLSESIRQLEARTQKNSLAVVELQAKLEQTLTQRIANELVYAMAGLLILALLVIAYSMWRLRGATRDIASDIAWRRKDSEARTEQPDNPGGNARAIFAHPKSNNTVLELEKNLASTPRGDSTASRDLRAPSIFSAVKTSLDEAEPIPPLVGPDHSEDPSNPDFLSRGPKTDLSAFDVQEPISPQPLSREVSTVHSPTTDSTWKDHGLSVPSAGSVSNIDLGGRRDTIVLVEDDDGIRMVTQLSLQTIGNWDVIAFASGEDALFAVPTLKPNLLLLDVSMPGMTGPQTLERMRALPSLENTPVVFLTASTSAAEVTSYRALGAVDVIAKPFDPQQLCQRIAAVLSSVGSTASIERPSRTALLVEDDASVRYLVRFILEREGWHVREAATGGVAMSAIAGTPADVVLLDVMLPEVDGLTILNALRASPAWAQVPVMMLTARGDEATVNRALAAGANDYLVKPFNTTELAERLKRLTSSP